MPNTLAGKPRPKGVPENTSTLNERVVLFAGQTIAGGDEDARLLSALGSSRMRSAVSVLGSSEYGTCGTVKACFWYLRSGKGPGVRVSLGKGGGAHDLDW